MIITILIPDTTMINFITIIIHCQQTVKICRSRALVEGGKFAKIQSLMDRPKPQAVQHTFH